jgi:hypothetical protein
MKMKPRLAFIRRAYLPVVERAREMFEVAYEDRQLPADEAVRLVKAQSSSPRPSGSTRPSSQRCPTA